MMNGFKLAIFTLNQWASDFDGNTKRIIQSVDLANEAGAAYRAGPELELCGYSLEDAFFESDTLFHCWSQLVKIIKHSEKMRMIVDIGMPVQFSALYNCRVIAFQGKIIAIRAKTSLAKDGNYREFRHFNSWRGGLKAYNLPRFVAKQLHQELVPMGADFILEVANFNECDNFRIGWEICQELWDPKNVSASLCQDFGCHLILNGSASYWELRKLNIILDMIKGISLRGGVCYAFSNSVGCDGQRFVLYGRSCIYSKGQLVAMTSTTTGLFKEVQMITYNIYPGKIDCYRARMGIQPNLSNKFGSMWDTANKDCSQLNSNHNILHLNVKLNRGSMESNVLPPLSMDFEQEIHLYVPLWLWDYLRRSGMKGFMIPLSGGLDSSSVATLVYTLANHLFTNIEEPEVVSYFSTVHNMTKQAIQSQLISAKEICKLLLKCSYLSTKYSSQETFTRAKLLAQAIGAEFISLSLHDVYVDFRRLLNPNSGHEVSLLDQNLQARLRMTATYHLSEGKRIVLATGNVDEGLMGYLTKYDCSSADINPIGGLCKADLKSYLKYCCSVSYRGEKDIVKILEEIIDAPPSAELTGSEQRDEDEIGITYNEISLLGKVRSGIYGPSGPRDTFRTIWQNRKLEPFCSVFRCFSSITEPSSDLQVATELATLVKRFYSRYSRNRHKSTVLTPALHAENYSPDDNRFDHRPFLYPLFKVQFQSIDSMVERIGYSGSIDDEEEE